MQKSPGHSAHPVQEHDEAPERKSLIDLPAEIRNLIYDYAIEVSPLRLKRLEKSYKVINRSQILCVNKQISCEYHSLALATADIETRVDDSNFEHVVVYLTQRTDKKTARFPPRDKNGRAQTFRIEMSAFRPGYDFAGIQQAWSSIADWIKSIEFLHETLVALDIQYVWKLNGSYKYPVVDWFEPGHEWQIRAAQAASFEKRGWEEWCKIRAARELEWPKYKD